MREKEIKILWGRSGNRCSICKLELTPDGDKETLGEMAHIVARSSDGPRGVSSLSLGERDCYKNLILLCPTHHIDIDKNCNDWSVEKLQNIKNNHEAWVSEQLSIGNIRVTEIDNTEFIRNRLQIWHVLSRDHVAAVLSLTPLRITGDQIDTIDEKVQLALEEANLPGKNPIQRVNRYHTRPSEHGLVNEKFPDLPKRFGHSCHIFRNGHCEYFQELGSDTDRITERIKEKDEDIKGAVFVIRYTDIAEVVDSGLAWLERLWQTILPYEYLDFQCMLLNTKCTTLFSSQDNWGESIFGHPTISERLIYKDILTKGHDFSLLELNVLKWVANCYGLVLHSKLDSNGKYTRPVTMR
jgi:hypothetical protein